MKPTESIKNSKLLCLLRFITASKLIKLYFIVGWFWFLWILFYDKARIKGKQSPFVLLHQKYSLSNIYNNQSTKRNYCNYKPFTPTDATLQQGAYNCVKTLLLGFLCDVILCHGFQKLFICEVSTFLPSFRQQFCQ